ncbi:MAG: DUF5615 family PIN-like protein [Promethearchaeota archaeon]
MKYLIDMALSPRTVDFLKKHNYNATRVNEVLPKNSDDESIFSYAIENNYCIITADLGFGEILAYAQAKKPSVIILRLEDQRVENVNKILKDSLSKIEKEIEKGSVIIIEDDRIRIRPLPI